MTGLLSRTDLLALIPDLSDDRLDALTHAGIVAPVQSPAGHGYRDLDAARLQLALELEELFELHDTGLRLVLSLIDQLHGMRGDMRAVLAALASEPPETRARLRGVIHRG